MGVQNGRGLISRIDKRGAACRSHDSHTMRNVLAGAIYNRNGGPYAAFARNLAGCAHTVSAGVPRAVCGLLCALGDNVLHCVQNEGWLRPIIHRGRDGLRHCHRNFSHLAHHDYPPRGAGDGRVGIHIRNNLRNGCSAQSVPQRALFRFVSVHDIYREKLWHTPLVRLAQRGNVRACVHGNGVCEAAFYNRCCGRNGARRALLGSGGKGKTARMCRACVRSVKFA